MGKKKPSRAEATLSFFKTRRKETAWNILLKRLCWPEWKLNGIQTWFWVLFPYTTQVLSLNTFHTWTWAKLHNKELMVRIPTSPIPKVLCFSEITLSISINHRLYNWSYFVSIFMQLWQKAFCQKQSKTILFKNCWLRDKSSNSLSEDPPSVFNFHDSSRTVIVNTDTLAEFKMRE